MMFHNTSLLSCITIFKKKIKSFTLEDKTPCAHAYLIDGP